MSATAVEQHPPIAAPAPSREDHYRGAQHDLIIRGSGFLSILGSLVTIALVLVYPPTAALGSAGVVLVLVCAVLGVGLGTLSLTLRNRPSMTAIHWWSFLGLVEVGALQWLAGGGKAPYVQLLILPMLGSAFSQSLRRCVPVVIVGGLVALSPALYSSVDLTSTLTELLLLGAMTLMTAVVISSTRVHRARLVDAGEQANVLAHVDPLTGMPNRRAFDETLELAIETWRRDGTSIALLLCDVNSFKQINDSFGHAIGDEVLQGIGRAMTETVRRPDTAFRWAGDEFAVILRDTDEVGASRVAARLRKAVHRQCRRPDGMGVSIGTGVAALKPGMSVEEALVEADRALFSHKARRGHLRGAA